MFDDNAPIHQSFTDTGHYDNFKDRIGSMKPADTQALAERLGIQINPSDPAETQAEALKYTSWKDFKYAYQKSTGAEY